MTSGKPPLKSARQAIDPKDLMAVERAATGLIGLSISLIVLGFIVEKFELFLHVLALQMKSATAVPPQLRYAAFYNYLGIAITAAGILLALYTYFYYIDWLAHLRRGELRLDTRIFRYLSAFVGLVGGLLVLSMLIFG